MIVTPIPVNLVLPPSAVPRSQGVHVSSIIRAIAAETGVLKAEWVEDLGELSLTDVREITDPVVLLRISIGLAWEAWYIPQILGPEGVLDHPSEMQVDGIFMTHDGESVDVIITPGDGYRLHRFDTLKTIHEVKATYKSTKTVGELENQWMWLTQMKAYCKGANTTRAKLHVLFLCGDYKFPITPQIKCWDVEFTKREIDDCWDLMREYRDYRQSKEK